MADLFLELVSQFIMAILVFKGMRAFEEAKKRRKTPEQQESELERLEGRVSALTARELEARDRCWILEDENTVLRFKVIELQKKLAEREE